LRWGRRREEAEGGEGGWRRGEEREGCRKVNMVQILYIHVYKRKMRPVETIPGMGGIYLAYCKNFYKCHNILPPSTTIKIF
jgi:hypothetical protein